MSAEPAGHENYSVGYRDQRPCLCQDFANFHGGDSARLQVAEKFRRVFRRDRDQQAAGGLRVEQHCLEVLGDSLFVANHAFGEVPVVLQPARNVAGADAI